MHLLGSLTFISCTPQGANILLVGTTEYSLSVHVDGGVKFHIMVTSEHTYKCTGIISHKTIDTPTAVPSLLEEENMLQLVFSIGEVTHQIHCTHITPISIKEYCIDEFGNKESVADAIKWYKANGSKVLSNLRERIK